ncbi:uncharacterized protein isoform X2 [Rhodnius prolixus]|uniref:uncharacterized protein isoform X2 n=1 Tax=Rhodnius prolixus TaxID=13249 RepID=UPI003D18CFF5
MGKKPGEKGKEWEKERRDKLNVGFQELCKLLPDHDPSITMSKMEILRKATEYIKHLQEKNEEIIKCGNENFLKSETERLKKRVAYLILKTTELVDALRQAGVPIPSKNKKKNAKAKSKVGSNSLNQQNSDPSLADKVENSNKPGKTTVKKKVVKCGCEKKIQLNKKPLSEINPMVLVSGTSASCPATASLSKTESEVCNGVPQSTSDSAKCSISSTDKSIPQVVTHKVVPSGNLVSQITTNSIVTQSVVHPLIQTTMSVLKPTQTLSVDKKELSKLGPGTLIFADGRIVNVPPVIPQIVVKPPPSAPAPAVILMQTPEIALQKPIVKLTTAEDKKEKFIVPKKREITMTTFVNKVPIPAVKAFRLEPCAREPRTKKKPNREQKKHHPVDNTSTASSTSTSNGVSNTVTNTTVGTSAETSLTKRKRHEEPDAVNKSQKSSSKIDSVTDQGETQCPESTSGKEEKSQSVKHSIVDIFNKQCGNEVENFNGASSEGTELTCHNPITQSEKIVTEIPSSFISSLTTSAQTVTDAVNSESTTNIANKDMSEKSSESVESLNRSISAVECAIPTTTVTITSVINTTVSSNSLNEEVVSSISEGTKTTSVQSGNDCDVITSDKTKNSFTSASILSQCVVPTVNPTPVTSASETTKDLPSIGKGTESVCKKVNDVSSIATVETSIAATCETGSIFNKTSSQVTTANMETFSLAISSTTSTISGDTFTSRSYTATKMNKTNIIPPKANVRTAVNIPISSASEIVVNKNSHPASSGCTPSRMTNVTVTSTMITKLPENSVSGRYMNSKSNEPKTFFSTNSCHNLSSFNMTPTTSVFSMTQGYSAPLVPNNTSKNTGVYMMPDMFSNSSHVPSKSVTNFNLDYSYNNTTNKARTLPSYTTADVFVNTDPLGQHGQSSSTVSLNDSNVNPVATSSTSTSFRMPSVSVGNANAFSKTYASSSYSMADVFVTSHLTYKNSSSFSSTGTDPCCLPPIVPKHNSSCCMSGADAQNVTTAKSTTSYPKNNLFPPIASSSYKTPGTFGTTDISVNTSSIVTKPITTFNMNEMFTHNVANVTTAAKMATFSMPDVHTSYNTPLCSSKPASFSVADVFTTSSSTLAKSSNTFTMPDLYSSSSVATSKTSLSFTSGQSSTVSFTMSNVSTDRPNKPCEQTATTLTSIAQHAPLYDAQHKIPPVPVITSNKTYNTGEKDKAYPVSSVGNNFKNDQCNDFLRTAKDIDRNFMPVMEEVRLTSDFSNDLFSSLQVPSGGHHSESISPTAAFLLAFPLVSTSKNTENLADTDNHENHQTSTPTTILQIGNIEPPSSELFHSIDFAKSKDFEVQTDLDYKTKQKQKQKNPTLNNHNQPSYSSYPLFTNDYNHQCDANWSKPMEKKKPEKVQKYQYDCYKQDKKKRKISVNWMTTPENDIYRDAEFPSSSGQYNIEMETFPDLCSTKKNQGNYSWSPSKSLLPLDNPLMIPSTLPTLVGDLALGTTTPSDPFKRCDKKDKQEEKKFSQPKSQSANFLSVSQLVDPKCKKQKPTTDRQYNKQKHATPTSGADKKRQCMGPPTNHNQREYQNTSKRKESNDPSCMYPDNFVPHFNWDNKHRYKGGSYSAESLIQQDVCDTFNFNYQQNNFFQNSEFGHDATQSGCGQYQNFLNISQGHFSSCVSEEYPADNFTLTGQSNNRMGATPIGQGVVPSSNEKQRNISHPLKDLHLRDESGYHCGSGTAATFHHYPPHHHQHQQHQQQQHPASYSTTNLQHNFSSVGGSGTGPPVPPPPPLPPPVSNYSVTTTSTLANFNLSTIFPEMNDQRVGTASGAPPRNHLNTFNNNQTCRGHFSQ